MVRNKWGVLGGWCHCGLRKIVPCQPRAQPPPHSNGQGLVRPSFYQPLGPVSVRRRSAALRGMCDNRGPHTDRCACVRLCLCAHEGVTTGRPTMIAVGAFKWVREGGGDGGTRSG